ncbi:hypothetical protein ACH4JS_13230 [Streptomyces sp. NPDC017638]|uniref:hypothetical protein n=1 Tax=Streptomyces sp. NPDC017638 TaxID=3365004 RepID=UPI003796EC9F
MLNSSFDALSISSRVGRAVGLPLLGRRRSAAGPPGSVAARRTRPSSGPSPDTDRAAARSAAGYSPGITVGRPGRPVYRSLRVAAVRSRLLAVCGLLGRAQAGQDEIAGLPDHARLSSAEPYLTPAPHRLRGAVDAVPSPRELTGGVR